ncbi:MAG: alcohol dehydrogenase [Chloroflexi bacterium]|nr:alcohol dehydrogenase [Chloroflexota bacterium]MBS60367.1 alcohol dehydrogenase [Anaerolineaceae bacterium]
MRVAMYYHNEEVRLENMTKPKIGVGDLMVKVAASGICGSDLMEWYRIKKAPCVLGHEVSGEVTEVGEGVTRFDVGDRVVFTHHVPCNDCSYCMRGEHTLCETIHSTFFDPGGFAEYIRVPKINLDKGGVIPLPSDVSFDVATFVEPLGCVIRGQRKIGMYPGDSVLVLGSGMAGLLNIRLASSMGAGCIVATDIHPIRIQAALDSGAYEAYNGLQEEVIERAISANNNKKFDHVIVCAPGEKIFEQALSSVTLGGSIMLYAFSAPEVKFTFSLHDVFSQGITIRSTYGASPMDLMQALELLHYKKVVVSDLITHKLALEDVSWGFRLASDGSESLKVIIEPNK